MDTDQISGPLLPFNLQSLESILPGNYGAFASALPGRTVSAARTAEMDRHLKQSNLQPHYDVSSQSNGHVPAVGFGDQTQTKFTVLPIPTDLDDAFESATAMSFLDQIERISD